MAKPKTEKEWAEYYDWAYSLLKSDSSLWKVFQKAIKEGWEKAKFIAEVRRTTWYQNHSESWRQTEALKHTDPESWRAKVRTIYNNITQLAGQMGLRLNWQTMWDMAEDALAFGWDNAKLKSQMAKFLKPGVGGYYGEAGEAEDQLRQYAFQMGVKINDGTLHGWLKGIIQGTRTVEDYKGWLQQQAISAFPTLAEQIKGGMTVRDIASPYMEAMGRILEINSEGLDLFDPLVRTALTGVNKETGKAELKPLWQFENELRQDPRWLKTNNARQSINSTARSIGQMFGVSI